MTYYNEHDPKAAAWLRELVANGIIPGGHIDTRSIADVRAEDLAGFSQCHFFAGIGGWPYALRLAGWPDDRPAWTGSCPCQPFSAAGKQRGTADERHLWPEFFRLIKACRPQTIFGEQVASAEVLGTDLEASFVEAVSRGDCALANRLAKRLVRSGSVHYEPRWLDGISTDMEEIGYSVRSNDIPAAGLGAPHIRQRLYWVADAERDSRGSRRIADESREGTGEEGARAHVELGRRCDAGGVEVAERNGCGSGPLRSACDETRDTLPEHGSQSRRVEHPEGVGREQRRAESGGGSVGARCEPCGVGHSEGDDQWRDPVSGFNREGEQARRPSGNGYWSRFEIIQCRDGKARRFEPGSFPLAHGIPGRVGLLRGYGNAIVPQVAAEFVRAYCESITPGPSHS